MNKAWIITADMGYGHQRAVYPLQRMAQNGIITANNDPLNSKKENKLWERTLKLYEFFSRVQAIPIIGKFLFLLLDALLKIPDDYESDLSDATFQVKLLQQSIKNGLCEGTIKRINSKKLPLITSFYAPAIAADMQGKNDIYCIICDADLNRVWVAKNPSNSSIKYFVPTLEAQNRLIQYGIKKEKIFYAGFPLPLELLGNQQLNVCKRNLANRLQNLDPNSVFQNAYKEEIGEQIGHYNINKNHSKLTIMFAIGGAGAQTKIAEEVALSLKEKILTNQVQLFLVAGTRRQVKYHFNRIHKNQFSLSENMKIISGESKNEYFENFNKTLHNTDILWTKPSELSFYAALGIPIIMAPPIGSQEKFNEKWLLKIGAAIPQQNPTNAHVWIFELLNSGKFAKMAWKGFINAEKKGTYKIFDTFNPQT